MSNRIAVRSRSPRRRMRGLTLIEILVVITILGLISGIVGVNVANAMADGRHKTTRVSMSNLRSTVVAYYAKHGHYPSTAEGLNALVNPPKGRPLLDAIPTDSWDQPFAYFGPSDAYKFKIVSPGEDGVLDTEDDLSIGKKR